MCSLFPICSPLSTLSFLLRCAKDPTHSCRVSLTNFATCEALKHVLPYTEQAVFCLNLTPKCGNLSLSCHSSITHTYTLTHAPRHSLTRTHSHTHMKTVMFTHTHKLTPKSKKKTVFYSNLKFSCSFYTDNCFGLGGGSKIMDTQDMVIFGLRTRRAPQASASG